MGWKVGIVRTGVTPGSRTQISLPCQVRLRDGTTAQVRAVQAPGDRQMLRDGFAALSPESRYNRFLSAMPSLSDDMIVRLVDEVDGIDHVAVVLTPTNRPGHPVAVARLIRYPEWPAAADIAVSVADDWQGRGVASALLPVLIANRPRGVTTLATEVATDNAASIAMLQRLGRTSLTVAATGVYHVDVRLEESAAGAGSRPHVVPDQATPPPGTVA